MSDGVGACGGAAGAYGGTVNKSGPNITGLVGNCPLVATGDVIEQQMPVGGNWGCRRAFTGVGGVITTKIDHYKVSKVIIEAMLT